MTDNTTFHPPINAPIHGSTEGATPLLTFDDVQDRLVEAMLTCWRHPDRERAWLRVRSAWPDVSAEPGDWDARAVGETSSDVALRPASATRREIAEMEAAFSWLDVVAPADRQIVGLAITELARGRREISWRSMLKRLGIPRGEDALRKRYGAAIAAICVAQTRRNPRADVSSKTIIDE